MIIKKLVLHNFGVYASTNEFVFSGSKPVVLIGGLNGHGKTTFLAGVLLALYGSNSFAYMESRYKSYSQYLCSYINKNDASLTSYIDLEFTMEATDHEVIRINRMWSLVTVRASEKIQAYKNGVFDQFLTDNWPMYIENILPSGLSNFFFFDGEKIAELAVEDTDKQMKESIKSLLGISVINLLENDVSRIIKKLSKQNINQEDHEDLDKLRTVKEEAAEKLRYIDVKIADLQNKISVISKKIEKAEHAYSSKGGDIVLQRQELFQEKAKLLSKIQQDKDGLLAEAASELPLLLVRDLLNNIRINAEKEYEEKTLESAIRKISNVFENYKTDHQEQAEQAGLFIEYFKKQTEDTMVEKIYNISDLALLQIQTLLDAKMSKKRNKVLERQKILEDNYHEMNQLDHYLSVDIDEMAIMRMYKEIKKMEQEKADLEVEYDVLLDKRRMLNGNSIEATGEFNKKVEQYLKRIEMKDDSERILKYSHIATTVLEEYKYRLLKNKLLKLGETMTDCYKKLANKKNLIAKIIIDEITLDLKYFNAKGEEVPKFSLSAGEKQLMVISMLWSLAICSKRKLPVIIDTPLSRLDSMHREALIKTYFPQAGSQTIILSTDSEIDANYYDIMKKDVGDEYTLYFDNMNNSTMIMKGFFERSSHDN